MVFESPHNPIGPASKKFFDISIFQFDQIAVTQEYVNSNAAKYLYSLMPDKFAELSLKYKNDDNGKSESERRRDALMLYHRMRKWLFQVKSGAATRCGYRRKEIGSGRLYSESMSLQGLSKFTRGVLCNGQQEDVDMMNAEPTVMLQLCETFGIATPVLAQYVLNREEILSDIISFYKSNREDAKKKVISVFNADPSRLNYKHRFLKLLSVEVCVIQRVLWDVKNNETLAHIRQYVSDNRDENQIGCFMVYVYQLYEDLILTYAREFFSNHNCTITTLSYDGLQILKCGAAEMLNDLTAYVYKKTDFTMPFAVKAFDTRLEVPTTYNEIQTYTQRRDEFNRCVVQVRSEYILFDPETKAVIDIFTKWELLDLYSQSVTDDSDSGAIKPFAKLWLKDSDNRVQYRTRNVYLRPEECPRDDIFNMWTPFKYQHAHCYTKKEKWEYYFSRVDNLVLALTNEKRGLADAIHDWVGQCAQYPEFKSFVIVIVGRQGCGKTTFVELLKLIFGANKVFVSTTPLRDVFGPFNSLVENAYIINFNEVSRRDFLTVEGQYKGLATDPTFTKNSKGKDQSIINSYHRLIVTSNHTNCVPLEHDDRRHMMIQAGTRLVRNKDFFNAFYLQVMEKPEAHIALWYYYCSVRKVPKKFNDEDVPVTWLKEMLQTESLDPVRQYVRYLILEHQTTTKSEEDATIHMPPYKPESGRYETVFSDFEAFCKRNNYPMNSISDSVLRRKLMSEIPGVTYGQIQMGNRTSRTKWTGITIDTAKARKHLGIETPIARSMKKVSAK